MTVSVFITGLLVGIAGSAGAASKPTVSQVRAKLAKLESQSQKLDQQFDQVQEQLATTNKRLSLVDKQESAFNTRFNDLRKEIGRIAVTAYEDGNLNASIALLTSGKPQQILDQSSILEELSASNAAQINDFLAAAKQLTTAQQLAERTRTGILQLKSSLAKRKTQMNKLVSQEQTLLAQLTPAQQTDLVGGGGTTKATDPIATTTQAGKAVAFAYARLGCPYVFGGTGPCADGYDCSGLTMEAWASAGVSIPRTSEEQWDQLPHVSTSNLQPGDILVFLDAGHVGIYVGNNQLIDAPHTGEDVQLVSFSGWYKTNLDGAVRP
ncbi:MAG TPA: NlpC/P60 family protein [Streptosporangiaceae bacterium]